MRVVFAHTNNFAPAALAAIQHYAPKAEFVETTGLYGYNEAIASRWDGSADLVVIEQDKEITAEVLPSFENCPELWCVYSYKNFPEPFTKTISTGLGCTKYSAEAQRITSVQEFIRPGYDLLPVCRRCNGDGCWVNLDGRIAMALSMHGFEPHIHGEITHHHEYPSLDAWIRELETNFEGSVIHG